LTFASFRRTTSGGGYIPSVDGLRFFAILSVFLFHLAAQMQLKAAMSPEITAGTNPLARLVSHGAWGVQLFFVISGFILGVPFARQYILRQGTVSVKRFYLRRLTRLEPPYILIMLVLFAVEVKFFHQPFRQLLPHLVASLFYVHNLVYHQLSTVNVVAWSLEIEVQFYVLVPLLSQALRITNSTLRRSMLLLVAAAFTILAFEGGGDRNPMVRLTLLGQGQYFFLGFLAADLYVDPKRVAMHPRLWDIVALAVSGLIVAVVQTGYAPFVLPLCFFLLLLAALFGQLYRTFLSLPFLSIVGGMCYTIYLLHFNVISAIGRVSMRHHIGTGFVANFAFQTLAVGIPVLVIAAIYFYFIEKPCMDPAWLQKLATLFRKTIHRAPRQL